MARERPARFCKACALSQRAKAKDNDVISLSQKSFCPVPDEQLSGGMGSPIIVQTCPLEPYTFH